MNIHAPVEANERLYPTPKVPAVAICLDGCEPAYLDAASAAGLTPHLDRIRRDGTDRTAHSVIPSFTNPNNLSIATGRPPSVHGICGNYLYEPETGEEVMMNDVRFLRAPTVFQQFYDQGAKVAIVTAKDKLRALLGRNHADWFDQFGYDYFTRETFTSFYPGKGSMWSIMHGTVALLHEQASARGLVLASTYA